MKFPKIRYDRAGNLIIPRGWRVLKRNEKLRENDAYAAWKKIELDVPKIIPFQNNWGGNFVSAKPLFFKTLCYIRKNGFTP